MVEILIYRQCIALAGEIFEITRAARQGSKKMSVRSILERGVGSSLSHPPFYTHLEAGHHKTQTSKEKSNQSSHLSQLSQRSQASGVALDS